MRLKALQSKRAALVSEFKAWLDTALTAASKEERELTADEQAKQKAYQAQLDTIDGLITAEKALAALSAQPSAVAVAQVVPAAAVPSAEPVPDAGPVARTEVGPGPVEKDPARGFAGPHPIADFARAVKAACTPGGVVDGRLIQGGLMAAPSNQHQSSGAEGAMVPPAMRAGIWQLVFDDPLMQLLTIEPTESPVVDVIGDETSPWAATGVQAKWRAEGTQMTATKLDTKTKQVRAHELYAFVLASEELLEDAPRLNDRLNNRAPAAIRWKIIESFMFGTGAGQPLGWAQTNYAGKVTVSRANASQISPTDVSKMFSRLLVQGGGDRSFWVSNRDTLPELVVRMTVGNMPVWLPPSGIQGAPNGSILGRPLFFSEHCQTLGTEGDLQLVNPDGYYAIQRGAARFDSSIHLFFDYNMSAFRWVTRFGGQPLLSAAVAAAKGSSSKSHFVILS